MRRTFLFITAAALSSTAALACTPKSKATAIQSPDSHAAAAGGQSESDEPSGSQDLATVCASAGPIAHATGSAPSSWRVEPSSMSAHGLLALGDRSYTMADLQSLEKQGRHAELLGHIEDVPPASRTAAWESLLARSATALVGSSTKGSDSNASFDAFMIAESLVARHSKLTASSEFMAKRAVAGTQMFARCFELTYSGDECVTMARDFIGVTGTDTKTVLAVAKTVRANQHPYVAVPFFHAAAKVDRDSCKDDDLALAIEAGLGLPSDYDNAKLSRELAQSVCFAELEQPIIAKLTGPDGGGYFKDNACAVLRGNGKVK